MVVVVVVLVLVLVLLVVSSVDLLRAGCQSERLSRSGRHSDGF